MRRQRVRRPAADSNGEATDGAAMARFALAAPPLAASHEGMNRLLQFQFALVAAALLLLLLVALFPGKPRVVQLRFDETVAAIETVQDEEDHAQRQQEMDRRAQQAALPQDGAKEVEWEVDRGEAPEAASAPMAPGGTRFLQEEVTKSPGGAPPPPEVVARFGLGGNVGVSAETVYR